MVETGAGPEDGDDNDAVDADAQTAAASDEDRIIEAEDLLGALKAERLRAKQRLSDLESHLAALQQQQQNKIEALKQQHQQELERQEAAWTGTKSALTTQLRPIKAGHRDEVKELKGDYSVRIKDKRAQHKERRKALNAELKRLARLIPEAERALKLLSNRGRLELILADDELMGTLKKRWIGAEVAKRLDYPIFMAVSERGGKNNSGEYEYLVDADGSLIEFPDGHPQAGQLVVDQDLVNYGLTRDDLGDAASLQNESLCIAEAFVRFAQQQGLSFWEGA